MDFPRQRPCKPIRISAGYFPQEKVGIYQSKGTLWKKEMASQVGPPGYDPELEAKPKTKAVKRNERNREKRLQAALEKDKNQLASQMNELTVSVNANIITPPLEATEENCTRYGLLDKLTKLEGFLKELKLLDDKKAEMAAS
ncbi:hypothetical protein I3842_Q029800 [Carya illinoinensis]|uniref:Partner of Y14 and mago n=1 Tax=Carya illinoinensis TaxID=32201 RepID=A0A921ZYU3_CARIL|nr:hypothetical protein I3842_Q029800 [Carya illinoinensis]